MEENTTVLIFVAITVHVFISVIYSGSIIKPLIKSKNIKNVETAPFFITFFFGYLISLLYFGFIKDGTDFNEIYPKDTESNDNMKEEDKRCNKDMIGKKARVSGSNIVVTIVGINGWKYACKNVVNDRSLEYYPNELEIE